MSQKPNQDAKNIGARFRSARSLVPDLNRKSFCERHGINRYTMQSWENGLHVSKGKNVERFIEALAREGVFCTSEWLIEGIGEPAKPMLQNGVKPRSETNTRSFEENTPSDHQFTLLIQALVGAYAHANIEIKILHLSDDAMAPKFLKGDVVVGKKINDRALAHQKYCILELSPDRIIARKVLVTKEGLMFIALDDRVPTFTLNNGTKIYEIVCHLVNQGQ